MLADFQESKRINVPLIIYRRRWGQDVTDYSKDVLKPRSLTTVIEIRHYSLHGMLPNPRFTLECVCLERNSCL